MKVCHLTSVHSYEDIRIFRKECRTLAKNGYETHLIAPNAPTEKVDGVFLHGINCVKNRRLERMTKLVFLLYKKALKIDADIYHFHDPELLIIGYLLKVRGKKVIYDVHEDVPRQILSKYWIPKYMRKSISVCIEFLEIILSKRFDGIICATPFIMERFKKIGCKSIVNINNYPIMNELFVQDDNNGMKKENAICYIGGINEIRGLHEMIKAIPPNVKLVLGGTFSNFEEREKAMKHKNWNQVEEKGYLSRAQVKKVLQNSVAGLVLFHPYPNHINAQPNKLFEYMSAGLPVIASDFPLWKEIIDKNRCGKCVNPFDINSIKKTIKYFIENPEIAFEMGRNGRKAIEEKYNWEKEGRNLLSFYMTL